MYDVKITNGTIVDGTGATRFVGDVAVKDGVVVEVSQSSLDGDAAETVDATGLLVTPGFVDIHTHYDGQATWDPLLEPSSGHGVTTVVAGNCGVGFAPVRPGDEQWLIALMEGVEDIPGTALTEGIDWGWETFPEYLDALDAPASSASTSACRCRTARCARTRWGSAARRNEPADPDEIAAMAAIVQEAVEAGALGFSTSRTLGHRAMDGRPVPGTFAAEDELFALGRAMPRGGRAVFELAPTGASGEDLLAPEREMAWMVRLSDDLGLPVSFTLAAGRRRPRPVARADGRVAARLRRRGAGGARRSRPARSACCSASRPATRSAGRPDVPRAGGTPLARRAARRAGQAGGARRRSSAEDDVAPDPTVLFDGFFQLVQGSLDRLYALGDPPDYEPTPERTIAAMAEAAGVAPLDDALRRDARARRASTC